MCHSLHVYSNPRLVCERTVEENILKKANQKRMLGDIAIEGGAFTTEFFKQVFPVGEQGDTFNPFLSLCRYSQ